MPAHYVKPYVKRNKTDGRDAEAICEAMSRPTMRFVSVKGEDAQAVLAMHRTRALLVRQRTMSANALRATLAEFGIVAAQGNAGLRTLMERVASQTCRSRRRRKRHCRCWLCNGSKWIWRCASSTGGSRGSRGSRRQRND